jgi:ribosomal protein S18 acetylase RimI-like enzyme
MTLIIRPIIDADREVWARLFIDYGVFYETSFDATIVDGVWRWLIDPSHPANALVAVKDDAVIGFALFREQPDTFTAGPSWYLDDLYVEPAARGTGAGTALIAALKAHAVAHGGGTIRWITAADNVTAQSVYDRVASKKTWITYELEA